MVGFNILASADEQDVSLEAVIFTLLQEAAQTERAIIKPGPAGHVSAYPEIFHTPNEIFATEIEMAKDQIAYPPSIKASPTAQALGRYIEVTNWLRYVHGHNRARAKRLLWLLAKNVHPRRIAYQEGFGSVAGVRAAKKRYLRSIAERLRRELPSLMDHFGQN